jgi:hypothetical protein
MPDDFPPGSSVLPELIRSAIKAVPAVRYALAVAGIGAAVALVAGFTIDLRVAVFGIIILFIFMAVMVVFARLASVAAGSLHVLAMVLAWAAVILIIAASVLLLLSVFFDKPLPLSRWIAGTPASAPTGNETPSPPIKAKLVYLMDSYNPDDVYDENTLEASGTNADDIRPVLAGLAETRTALLTNVQNDPRQREVIDADPDLVVTHRGSFLGKTPDQQEQKLDQFLRDMAAKKAKFLIYSRSTDFTDPSQRSAWISQRESVDTGLKGRIFFFSLANASEKTFKNPTVANDFRAEVKRILGIN